MNQMIAIPGTSVAQTMFSVSIAGPSKTATTGKKIRSFLNLPNGWYYGQGSPPSHAVVQKALVLLVRFMTYGFNETDAFPGINGEIMVTAYRGDCCIELTIDPDRTFTVSYEVSGTNVSYEPELSGIQAIAELNRIVGIMGRQECATSESFTSGITTTNAAGNLSIWPLDQPGMGYPYFWNAAGYPQAEPLAPIFSDSMPTSPDHRRYFGNSTQPSLDRSAA